MRKPNLSRLRRPPLVLRLMLDSKVAAEASLMAKVNQLSGLEAELAQLTHEDVVPGMSEIVDHK